MGDSHICSAGPWDVSSLWAGGGAAISHPGGSGPSWTLRLPLITTARKARPFRGAAGPRSVSITLGMKGSDGLKCPKLKMLTPEVSRLDCQGKHILFPRLLLKFSGVIPLFSS